MKNNEATVDTVQKRRNLEVGIALGVIILILAIVTVSSGKIKTSETSHTSELEAIVYQDYINDDATGTWRLARTGTATPTVDYALDYYHEYFTDDSEVHFVVNYALETTTRIVADDGKLYITTFSYIDDEEYSARHIPCGEQLSEKEIKIK